MKQIDNYRLTKELGKGTSAIVYQAVDDKTNQIVAVKAIPGQKLEDKRSMENFKRELNLLHNLNHENIIKIIGLKKTSRFCYLILEYCNGGNLYEYKCHYEKKKKANMNEFFVQKILRQLITGLEHMHINNTVHRDIKLENILLNFHSISNKVQPGGMPSPLNLDSVSLNDPFTLKIADLGFARELEEHGVASTICGTPITMAPDVINANEVGTDKDSKYNSKADLWSLGAITYELLIGRPPFYASDYQLLFKQLNEGKYTLPKHLKLSIEAITFINGLLQFYPEKRMGWDEIKQHPFIRKSIEEFHFIDLHSIQDDYSNPQTLEISSKKCDNFLWLKFKNASFNMELDKVNDQAIAKPEIKQIIEEKKTVNEDILKEVEEEKKRIEEEKLKLQKDKQEAEKMRIEAEKIRKEAVQLKKITEEERQKLHKEEQARNKQLEEEKKVELKKKQEEETLRKKEKETLDKEKERVLEEKRRIEKLKLDAEEQLKSAEKLKKDLEETTNEIMIQKEIEEKKRQEEEKQRKIDEKKRKEEEDKLNEELLKKEQQHKEEEEKLMKELLLLKNESEKLKLEVEEKKQFQKALEQEEKEKEKLQLKIQEIKNESEKKLMEMENEKKQKELLYEQEKQKREQEELLKKEIELQQNIQNKEKELKLFQIQAEITINQQTISNKKKLMEIIGDKEDQWEFLSSKSEEIDYQIEDTSPYDMIQEYFVLDNKP